MGLIDTYILSRANSWYDKLSAKQDRPCTYNVILRRVRVTTVVTKKL